MLVEGERWRVMCGDAFEVVRSMADNSVDAVVTDPPYGITWDTDYTRFTNGAAKHRTFDAIIGDNHGFDPTPWLAFPKVVLFGFHAFSNLLPAGSLLIWCKRRDSKLGKFLSDCEVAWMKGGSLIRLFHHEWDGFMRESERSETRLHPTQKPIALMEWVLEQADIPQGATILDPFCGSGSTGVAAIKTGRRFLGIEISEDYCQIARRRIADAAAQLALPLEMEP